MLTWLLFLLAGHSVSTVKVRAVPFRAVRGGEDTDMGLECLPSRQPVIYCFDLFRYHSEWYSVPDYVSNLVHQNTHRALELSVTPFLILSWVRIPLPHHFKIALTELLQKRVLDE